MGYAIGISQFKLNNADQCQYSIIIKRLNRPCATMVTFQY